MGLNWCANHSKNQGINILYKSLESKCAITYGLTVGFPNSTFPSGVIGVSDG